MFLTVHATVGAVLGKSIPNPWVAFLFGFLSHFLVDMIPHGNESVLMTGVTQRDRVRRLLSVVAVDGALVLALLAWWIFGQHIENPWSVFGAVVGALVPDALQAPRQIFQSTILSRYERFHHNWHLHYHPRFASTLIPFSAGMMIQSVTFLIFLWWTM